MKMVVEVKRNGEHMRKPHEPIIEHNMSIRYHEKIAYNHVIDIFRDYQQTWGSEYEHQEDIYNLKEGVYDIDTGDYTNVVTIKKV